MTITREKTIVIIGAGVIGLSSALCLQTAGYRVAVIAQDFPEPTDFAAPDPAERRINYASQWAGAHNRWVPATTSWEQRDHDFALATFAHMRRVVAADATSPNPRPSLASPEAGVTFLKAEEYLEVPHPEYLALTEARARELGMQGFRLLSRAEMPPDVVWACEYDTWCVNPMVYLAYLARRLALGGCLFVKKQLQELDDAFKPNPLIGPVLAVVNCSGWGFADPDVFPIRGQTAVVSNQCSKTITRQRKDGSWTFCIPRGLSGGTIIGGTKQPNDMNPHACPETRAGLLRAFTETNRSFVASDMAQTGPLHWVRDIVGRRPARHGGMRLEPEVLTPGKIVVHAYGLGGRGYELSWGVAEAVAKLVEKAVATGERGGERAKL
ncbi:hypothetical protein HOO65_010644 [Ceratocystis lukuohia]|uniref:FAD dependent oxidoreductase domain-containing protein n=1 Tax=Ceratocystis lukuohia TaxID=2019550 RepID=A0ABR4MSP7_9PEZI